MVRGSVQEPLGVYNESITPYESYFGLHRAIALVRGTTLGGLMSLSLPSWVEQR